jgi:hypothetical protein
MKQYLCTRYPVDKKNGGVSRSWLLDQRHTAKYPNLLVEIALHPAPPALIAFRSGLTEDVLVDILLGKDSISYDEAQGLREALHTDTGYPSYEFAFKNTLSSFEETEAGGILKESRRDARKLKGKHPAIPLIKAILKEEAPPHAALMMLDAYRDYMQPEYVRRVQITPRELPLNVWEVYEGTEESLNPDMIDRLSEAAHDALCKALLNRKEAC